MSTRRTTGPVVGFRLDIPESEALTAVAKSEGKTVGALAKEWVRERLSGVVDASRVQRLLTEIELLRHELRSAAEHAEQDAKTNAEMLQKALVALLVSVGRSEAEAKRFADRIRRP